MFEPGAMGLSSGYGSVGSNEERFKVLDRALELGSTFWDTSDVCKIMSQKSFLRILEIDIVQTLTMRISSGRGSSIQENETKYSCAPNSV